MDKLRLRRVSNGGERRRNISLRILEKGTPLPKPIEYADIDNAMFEWVDKKFDLTCNGKKLPTYKLYSTQRLSEYAQSWSNLDESGSLILNFKTITREMNPQKGMSQGGYFNIPGHKDFAVFYVPILQENGTEAFDRYTIKQPFAVSLIYTVSIITNKVELLNEMNQLMNYEFNAINAFLYPNEHPMSMKLDSVSDDSEYSIEDRKYYAQSYKITVNGYIIRKEDFSVERIPSRFVMAMKDSVGNEYRRGKNRRLSERVTFMEDLPNTSKTKKFTLSAMGGESDCETFPFGNDKMRAQEIVPIEDADTSCCIEEVDKYYNKVVKILIDFDECLTEIKFAIDKDIVINSVEVENVHDFRILINQEVVSLDDEIKMYAEDEITVKISRKDMFAKSSLTLVGYDPNVAIDSSDLKESPLDEPIGEEIIEINTASDEEEDSQGES